MTGPQPALPFPAHDITGHAGVYFHGLAWAVAMLHADGRRVRTAEAYGDGCEERARREVLGEGSEGR